MKFACSVSAVWIGIARIRSDFETSLAETRREHAPVRGVWLESVRQVEAGLGVKPDLKVLLMTGYAHEPPTQMLKARKIKILHKPFNLELLCTMAAEMVGA